MCHVPFSGQEVKGQGYTQMVNIFAVGAGGILVDHWSTISDDRCTGAKIQYNKPGDRFYIMSVNSSVSWLRLSALTNVKQSE